MKAFHHERAAIAFLSKISESASKILWDHGDINIFWAETHSTHPHPPHVCMRVQYSASHASLQTTKEHLTIPINRSNKSCFKAKAAIFHSAHWAEPRDRPMNQFTKASVAHAPGFYAVGIAS